MFTTLILQLYMRAKIVLELNHQIPRQIEIELWDSYIRKETTLKRDCGKTLFDSVKFRRGTSSLSVVGWQLCRISYCFCIFFFSSFLYSFSLFWLKIDKPSWEERVWVGTAHQLTHILLQIIWYSIYLLISHHIIYSKWNLI